MLRDCITAARIGLVVSALLLLWQLAAYLTDSIPDHLLPFVRLISGTEQAVPVAYMWTAMLGLFCVLGFLGSLLTLVCANLILRHTRHDNI
jgi:hypothetical protein